MCVCVYVCVKSAYHAALHCWVLVQNTVVKYICFRWIPQIPYIGSTKIMNVDNYHIQLRNAWRQRSHFIHNKRLRFIIIFRRSFSIQNDWHWRLRTGAPAKQQWAQFWYKKLFLMIRLYDLLTGTGVSSVRPWKKCELTFLLEPLLGDSLAFWSEEALDEHCWAVSFACYTTVQ